MKLNVNHPTFIAFLENINNTILSNIKINNYFKVTPEKKFAIQYMVLKQMKNAVKLNSKLSSEETLNFINLLQSKNESIENYEFAGVLNDIIINFDTLNEMTKTGIKQKRVIKVDKSTNE